jgi:hypothetical protein
MLHTHSYDNFKDIATAVLSDIVDLVLVDVRSKNSIIRLSSSSLRSVAVESWLKRG